MFKKTLLVVLSMIFLLPAFSFAGSADTEQIPSCPICGMDRAKFAHSRMLIQYEDKSQFGACSLHCAALEMAYHPGKIPAKIEVGDFFSKQLIDAHQAAWVLGGSKMGVMTANAKWAFENKAGAEKFIAKHGGRLADFETAISAAFADMYKDTLMIREKRKKMSHMKKGKMSPGGHQHQ